MTITDELLLFVWEKARETGWRQAGQFKQTQIPSAEAAGIRVTEELNQGRSPARGQPIIERSRLEKLFLY
jgi:hypothetical protein